jgi:hypothetical protein
MKSGTYHGPVGKEQGSGLQLCGWSQLLELCIGAINDLNYLQKMTKILEEEKKFTTDDDKSSSQTFANMVDKGSQSVLDSFF